MKLLLFGGSFDPPHIGHMSILRNAIAAVQPDRVLVVPAGTPPHKAAGETPAATRLAMCACFLPLFPALEISDMEIRRSGKSYTWDTVEQLGRENPGAELYLCIGSDMLLAFTAWHRYRELLAAVTLVVQNRRSEDAAPVLAAAEALKEQGGRILFSGGEVEEVSSTQIRADIAAGKSVQGLIPPPADGIVQREGLYRACTVAQAKELARQMLSDKRYEHTKNVAAAAKHLAERYGADVQKAELAAWLHDITKEKNGQQMLQILAQDAIIAQQTVRRPKPVWHGPCAAVFAKNELAVQDEDVLGAIACHTTGRPGMSLLDKVLLVADMTSAERSYEGVEELRRLADQDLDAAVLASIRRSVAFVEERGKEVDEESAAALRDIEAR